MKLATNIHREKALLKMFSRSEVKGQDHFLIVVNELYYYNSYS